MSEEGTRVRIGERELYCFDAFEAQFLAGDVEHYFEGDVKLSAGATVLDVGANIGVFAARVLDRLGGDARIFAFEPLPPIAEVLAKNAALIFGGKVQVFAHGLGAREEELEFTFFPMMSCLSSSRRSNADFSTERRRVAAACLALIRQGGLLPHLRTLPDELLESLVDSYLASRLVGRTYPARVRPLSAVLDETGIGAIDLLKIDVEGAELEVLAGIDDRHWPQVRQIVIEVERFLEQGPGTLRFLEARGFASRSVQDAGMLAGDYGLVYGQR